VWHKDPTKPVTLPDDNPDVFVLYVNLTYTGRLATGGPGEWLKLVRLYVLAEKLQDNRAKNDTIDPMQAFMQEFPLGNAPADASFRSLIPPPISAESIVELCEGTPAGSQARRLAARRKREAASGLCLRAC
jgi:hypothetical protein